jgi:hypothetical protein
MTQTSLTSNITLLNNFLTNINFIKSTVRGLKDIDHLCKLQTNSKSIGMLLRYIKLTVCVFFFKCH